ncbi:MAG TPA: inositol monophosphatase, partial [Micromonosporaceae bacterium]
MTKYQDLLPVAVEAIEHAHHLIRSHAPGILTVKGDRDLASEVDYLIEREVRSFLHERTPGIGFLSEEEGATGPGDLHWALDPVDGTVNYVHGIPLCAVSLGLVRKGRPVIGVIDLPFLGARYTAVEGAGAYVSGRQIKTSTTQNLNEAVVAIG